VKLADTAAERDLYESLAEIYSIIITLEALEKAYLRDSIKESEYTETCDRLLRQYKSNLADDHVHDAFGDLDRFKAEWDVCWNTRVKDGQRTRANDWDSSMCPKRQSG
jgi:ESCRT-I complex subunit VPS28